MPSTVRDTLQSKIQAAFSPTYLDMLNESNNHNVPPGSESHWKLVIVSASFAGKFPVARQQAVYKVLADEMAGPVHALSMFTFTPAEWAAKTGNAGASGGRRELPAARWGGSRVAQVSGWGRAQIGVSSGGRPTPQKRGPTCRPNRGPRPRGFQPGQGIGPRQGPTDSGPRQRHKAA